MHEPYTYSGIVLVSHHCRSCEMSYGISLTVHRSLSIRSANSRSVSLEDEQCMLRQLTSTDGPDYIQTYSGRKKGEQAPHLFAIAEDALDAMRRGAGGGGIDQTGAGDQTIVVSGERSVTIFSWRNIC